MIPTPNYYPPPTLNLHQTPSRFIMWEHSATERSSIPAETGTCMRLTVLTHTNQDLALIRSLPFVTKIGVGNVIKGWDEGTRHSFHLYQHHAQVELFPLGVLQLSLGQKATLTVTPDYVRNF
jgi:hypothetical protein